MASIYLWDALVLSIDGYSRSVELASLIVDESKSWFQFGDLTKG